MVIVIDVARLALCASGRDGLFEIKATPNSPEFKIALNGSRSSGISSVKAFCHAYIIFERQQKNDVPISIFDLMHTLRLAVAGFRTDP